MKKTVAIGTQFENTRIFYEQLLRSVIGNRFNIESYNFSGYRGKQIHPDVLLISTPFIINSARPYVHHDTKIIRIQRTFTKEAYHLLSQIDSEDDILLVNNGIDVTFESIALIYSLGFTFKLHPCYPELETPKHIRYAITLEEEPLVPSHVKTVYNLGRMVYTVSTLNELLEYLDVEPGERDEILHDYKQGVISNESGLQTLIDSSVLTKNEMQAVLDLIGEGVISTDNKGLVTMVNAKALEVFKTEKSLLINRPLDALFPGRSTSFHKEQHDVLIRVGNEQLIVDSRPTIIFGERIGTIVTLKKVTELRKLEERMRKSISIKGHITNYCLKDILGTSQPLLKAKAMAQKMALSDSSIIITGESGTGKELFAQAIHQESKRKTFPFVAVNCAALPENLMESELFGYEGGAFTGASASGKPGLFEDAHLGTLFLDEIGDISLGLQVRLLRVLQEGEVVRVGSSKIRKVDVRIISATNKNLRELTENGDFRWDLYYRLNVFPLKLPPLRNRKEDIQSLFYHFLFQYGSTKRVSAELMDILKQYHWPGNIRELQNVAEYLAQLGSDPMVPEDLPFDISPMNEIAVHKREGACEFLCDPVKDSMLNLLHERGRLKKITGRKKIAELLANSGIYLTEREVRTRLKELESEGLVRIGTGKQGTSITAAGIRYVRRLLE
jgi:transcriptional regulator with PAS, ATPase and Fis domain